ncbi:hypothetical protein DPX16_13638 [Anabarilius grahami]|uniref:Uncharacterized protein n=1 Tax=Anabarilius grahami TaxID=495550 RepID=A0A3N0XRJ8_ANAGA|nr:hypothetical protein DPX16_13638 [Anabarilius grahami]
MHVSEEKERESCLTGLPKGYSLVWVIRDEKMSEYPGDEEVAQPGQKAGKPCFAYSKLTLCQSTVLKKREQQTHLCCRCSSAGDDEGEVETPSGGRRGFEGIPHIISSDMEDLTKLPVYKLLNQSAVKSVLAAVHKSHPSRQSTITADLLLSAPRIIAAHGYKDFAQQCGFSMRQGYLETRSS